MVAVVSPGSGSLGRALIAMAALATGGGCSVIVDTTGLSSGESTEGGVPASVDSGGAPGKTGGEIGADAASPPLDAAAVLPDGAGPGPTPADAGDTSAGDSGSPGSGDAGIDAGGPDDASEPSDTSGGSCGPTDTIANCGSCGAACDTASGSPSCDGTRCSYTCGSGSSDCDQTGADTDGCECATPACCGASCQTAHSDGVGQSYYDCLSAATYDSKTAMEACAAYAGSNAAGCSSGWSCNGDTTRYVCFSSDGTSNNCGPYCWAYSGSGAGKVVDCSCPGNPQGNWN